MVRGLDLFREKFRPFPRQYVLIGGAACDLLLSEAGLPFRATKDLDIVLCVEAIEANFMDAFWKKNHRGAIRPRTCAFDPPQGEGLA